ncbi:MAG: enoyl-CoA hydratase [Gammaproteobacteria bacterium]|jgi:2-(1,2-epoxy-1,2-dihydrophenyl)acetyl-CoA isomerase|nr:enoyl-CoA hydratase [Gammaproteobacteria bacterium]MBT5054085.1 enoyl-CoA hydratase [Gammaproteobacteria bacterium]
MSDHLIETLDAGVCTLTMNRPQARNAMSGSMMAALNEAIPRVAADPAVRCVVLTGAGGAFCSGGDVKGFASDNAGGSGTIPSLEERVHNLRQGMELSRWLHEMPKPTLAIIPGAAAGAGLSMALACDLRFSLDTAKITTAFSKIGASGDYGGSYFLPYLVGAAKARELYFTADVISGAEAFAMGLVSKVASADVFDAESKAYAQMLANLPTVAVGYMKKNLNTAQNGTLADVFDREAMHMMRCFMTEDHKAAAKAFVEKKPPVFYGR